MFKKRFSKLETYYLYHLTQLLQIFSRSIQCRIRKLMPLVGDPSGWGDRTRSLFIYVSHEATKMVSRWQRVYRVGSLVASCVTSTVQAEETRLKRQRCHYSQTSRAQSPFNLSYTWCNMLLTGLHYSPVVSIPFFLPSISSILPLHPHPLRARELGVIIIVNAYKITY